MCGEDKRKKHKMKMKGNYKKCWRKFKFASSNHLNAFFTTFFFFLYLINERKKEFFFIKRCFNGIVLMNFFLNEILIKLLQVFST